MKEKSIKRKCFIAVTLCLSVIFLASCSKDGANVYVPKDALSMGNVNVKDLAEKCDIDGIQKLSLYKTLKSELKRESYEAEQLLDQLLSDPASCGIDLRKDIVWSLNDESLIEVVALMLDKNNFEKNVNNLFSDYTIKDRDDYSYIIDDNDFVLAWDKEKAILLTGYNDELLNEVGKLMTLKKENSIVSNNNFAEYWKNRGDIGAFVDFGTLVSYPSFKRELKDVPQQYLANIEKSSIYIATHFEKGQFNVHLQEINLDNKYVDKLFSQKFNDKLLNYMPQKALAAATFSFSPSVVIDAIKEEDESALKEKISRVYTVNDLLNCFNGSFACAVSDLNQDKYGKYMPTFTLTADLADSKLAENILNETGLQEKNGCYNVEDDIYLAVKDDIAILTNDQKYMNKQSKGLGDIASDAKSGFFVYADYDINNYPKSIKSGLSKDSQSFLSDLAGSVSLKTNGSDAFDLTLSLPTGNDNILAYVIKLVDNYYYKAENIAEDIENVFYPKKQNRSRYYDEYEIFD